ncbi:MAG: VWA domain-containing protein [Isosphaeraceae bacterium]
MDWAHPERLWLLSPILLLIPRAWWGRVRRARDWKALGQGGKPLGDGDLAWLGALACLAMALAQPRWGRTDPPPLPPGHDLVLALDVSRSMGVEDAVPDRLGLAVEAAVGLVETLGADPGRGDRVAVVAFAGKGVTRCPLTENLGAVVDALRSLQPGDVAPGGTDLAAALDASAEAFDDQERAEGRSVILFSDGEDHHDRWRPALARARDRGVIVHAVAVGDAVEAAPVPSRPRSGSSTEALTHGGQPVRSRRVDAALEEIASGTAGAFVPLGLAQADLGRLYASRIEPVAQSRRAAARGSRPAERFDVFLLAALAFALMASRPRRSPVKALREGVALTGVALAVLGTLGAGPDRDPREQVAQGRRAYFEGRFDEALTWFSAASRDAPTSPWPIYDRAATLYQLGRFEEARSDYSRARPLADEALRTKIDYALGNTAVALGALDDALAFYDACLGSTATGPDLDEVRRLAEGNRRFVVESARREPGTGKEDDPDRADGGKSSEAERDAPGDPPTEGPEGSQDAPSGFRGPGGAGGTGRAPPASGSPEARLDEALANVRESRGRRLDPKPTDGASQDFKDW